MAEPYHHGIHIHKLKMSLNERPHHVSIEERLNSHLRHFKTPSLTQTLAAELRWMILGVNSMILLRAVCTVELVLFTWKETLQCIVAHCCASRCFLSLYRNIIFTLHHCNSAYLTSNATLSLDQLCASLFMTFFHCQNQIFQYRKAKQTTASWHIPPVGNSFSRIYAICRLRSLSASVSL